ncbi:hypothetical protein RRG08_013902 [Elysia crispata]|uniref:Uncharacterized protein n=1 Tax=Elysia crispata TaxID=231223 RepID=A0AAE0XT98_9GAST|nr:hypothetical protein RRG08_013902 [Elysia crispata]
MRVQALPLRRSGRGKITSFMLLTVETPRVTQVNQCNQRHHDRLTLEHSQHKQTLRIPQDQTFYSDILFLANFCTVAPRFRSSTCI